MTLDRTQKAKLIKRFAPLLFLHPSEDYFPVRPEAFIKRSALWSAQVPYDDKAFWGKGINDTREPLIPRGGLSPDNAFFTEPNGEVELWLETSGWAGSNKVEFSTDNKTCNAVTPNNPYQLNTDGPWFYAEVCDLTTISSLFEFQTVREQIGLDWNGFLEIIGTVNIICYYFLFPRHTEVGKLARADGSLEPSGSYEGDWACFCVITKHDDDETDIERVEPIFAGFSKSRRGASIDFGSEFIQEYIDLLPWSQVPTASDHAGINISLGTHNLYPLDVKQGEAGGIRPQWFDFGVSVSEPVNKLGRDILESPATKAGSAVILAKMLAGLAIGGLLGTLIGAIAGVAEAVAINEGLDEKPELQPGDGQPPEWPDDLEDPRDELQDPIESRAIVPRGQEGLVLVLTGVAADVNNLSYWIDDDEKTIVDRTQQLFWSDWLGSDLGYKGRWGVRCSDDPFARRAGGKFPEFRLQVLKRLVVVI